MLAARELMMPVAHDGFGEGEWPCPQPGEGCHRKPRSTAAEVRKRLSSGAHDELCPYVWLSLRPMLHITYAAQDGGEARHTGIGTWPCRPELAGILISAGVLLGFLEFVFLVGNMAIAYSGSQCVPQAL